MNLDNKFIWKSLGLFTLVAVLVLAGIHIGAKTQRRIQEHPTIPEAVADVYPKHLQDDSPYPVPIKVPVRRWKTNTPLFVRALLPQENGPSENPWNVQAGFLECVSRKLECTPEDFDLTSSADVELAARTYFEIYDVSGWAEMYSLPEDIVAAAMFRGGCEGWIKHLEYGCYVNNTLDDYEQQGAITYTKPAPWEGVGVR